LAMSSGATSFKHLKNYDLEEFRITSTESINIEVMG